MDNLGGRWQVDGVTGEMRSAMSFVSSCQLLKLHGGSLCCFYWFCMCLKFYIVKKEDTLRDKSVLCELMLFELETEVGS